MAAGWATAACCGDGRVVGDGRAVGDGRRRCEEEAPLHGVSPLTRPASAFAAWRSSPAPSWRSIDVDALESEQQTITTPWARAPPACGVHRASCPKACRRRALRL
jgi:hypothetical protein